MEESDNPNLIDRCLEGNIIVLFLFFLIFVYFHFTFYYIGIVYCIKLLGIFDMVIEKDTFILFLTKETGLLNKEK